MAEALGLFVAVARVSGRRAIVVSLPQRIANWKIREAYLRVERERIGRQPSLRDVLPPKQA